MRVVKINRKILFILDKDESDETIEHFAHLFSRHGNTYSSYKFKFFMEAFQDPKLRNYVLVLDSPKK